MSGTCNVLVQGLETLQAWLQRGGKTEHHEHAIDLPQNIVLPSITQVLRLVDLSTVDTLCDQRTEVGAKRSSIEQLLTAALELSAWLLKGLPDRDTPWDSGDLAAYLAELFRLLRVCYDGRLSTAHAEQLWALVTALERCMPLTTFAHCVPPVDCSFTMQAAGM